MPDKTVKVWASFTVVGFHNWPEAPAIVSYLANSHRHLFKIAVAVQVTENNRQVEFHTLKALCLDALHGLYKLASAVIEEAFDFGNSSCEMIAEKLATKLHEKYGHVIVEVSEDGEHGSIVELS